MPPLPHIPSIPPPSDPGVPKKSSQQVHPEDTVQPMAISEQPLSENVSLHLSRDSQNMSTHRNHLNELPEIREDRISQLQQAIENGMYSVSAEQLAEKLIQEL